MICQQREDGMRRRAGQNLKLTLILKNSEPPHEIAVASKPILPNATETFQIENCQLMEWFFPQRPKTFLIRQFAQLVEMSAVSGLQVRIAQHCAEGGSEGQGKRGLHAVPGPAFHHLQEGDVRFGDCLKKPGLLQGPFVFGMTHKRQVSVQNERKVSLHRVFLGGRFQFQLGTIE
jgi:hypothetical protein